MFSYDRAQLKANAREQIRSCRSIYLVGIVFLLITEVLSFLSTRISYPNVSVDTLTQALSSSDPQRIYSLLSGSSSFLGQLITLALSVMSLVISAGFAFAALNVMRGRAPVVGDLFEPFGFFLKLFALEIVTGFFTLLWSLLFIIPGIVASLRYSQAVYILIDDPDKGVMQCIRESKSMMAGRKWDLFVLQLSFIGWDILAAIPFVSIYVTPYEYTTYAAFYLCVSGQTVAAQNDTQAF